MLWIMLRRRISQNIVFPGARNSKAPKLAKGHHSEKEKGEKRAETGTEMNCTQEFFEMQSAKENWDGRDQTNPILFNSLFQEIYWS